MLGYAAVTVDTIDDPDVILPEVVDTAVALWNAQQVGPADD